LAGNGAKPLVNVVRKNAPDLEKELENMKPVDSNDPKKFSEKGYQLLQRGLYEEVWII